MCIILGDSLKLFYQQNTLHEHMDFLYICKIPLMSILLELYNYFIFL